MRAIKLFIATAAVLSMSAAPALARTTTTANATSAAQKLSLSNTAPQRASTDPGNSNRAGSGVILAVLAAVAVIAGIVILADDDDSP